MVDLNVTKILVVLVVALLVLGPDKLPAVARQAAGFYNDLRRFRDSFNAEVRETFGDLGGIPALPTRGRTWVKSVTADAFQETPPAEISLPSAGSQPVVAQPGSGGPPGSQMIAKSSTEAPPGTSPGRAGDNEGDSEFDLAFN